MKKIYKKIIITISIIIISSILNTCEVSAYKDINLNAKSASPEYKTTQERIESIKDANVENTIKKQDQSEQNNNTNNNKNDNKKTTKIIIISIIVALIVLVIIALKIK